jgi:hypothetical protein
MESISESKRNLRVGRDATNSGNRPFQKECVVSDALANFPLAIERVRLHKGTRLDKHLSDFDVAIELLYYQRGKAGQAA